MKEKSLTPKKSKNLVDINYHKILILLWYIFTEHSKLLLKVQVSCKPFFTSYYDIKLRHSAHFKVFYQI